MSDNMQGFATGLDCSRYLTLIEFQSILTRSKLNIFERPTNQKNRADSAALLVFEAFKNIEF